MHVWAHRGIGARMPENTLEAFQLAIDEGAYGIELDVHLSRDGVCVVCHDETIDRTSDGTGMIANLTLAELRQFDFSQVEGKTFPGVGPCAIPTLAEVLALAAPSALKVNIELKTDRTVYPGIEERVLDEIRAAGMEQRVIVSSFNRESVARFKALGSGIPVAFLFSRPPRRLKRDIRAGEWDAIHPYRLWARRGLIRAAHKAGVQVRAYTVDDENEARRLMRRGIDGIFTNDATTMAAAVAVPR